MIKRAKTKPASRRTKQSRKFCKIQHRKVPVRPLSDLTALTSRKSPNRKWARQTSRLSISDRDAENRAMADFHPDLLADLAYVHLSLKMGLKSEPLETAFRAGLSLMRQMRPRDPLERMALSEALLAHARAAWFTMLLDGRTEPSVLAVIAEAAEGAAGTFGRLMRAIAEYRRPHNSSATVSIGQANLGHQQIVQNVPTQEAQGKENVDEQTRIHAKSPSPASKTLQAHAKGLEVTASGHPKITAMDEKQRPENPGRKIQGGDERVQARRAISGRRRAAKAIPSDD